MLSQKLISQLRERLRARRREIIDLRQSLDDSWKELHAPEVETEEAAQKETLAKTLDQLDEREKAEIEAIDVALGKIDIGSYGICESCGEEISPERLKSIPWTRVCSRCASQDQ